MIDEMAAEIAAHEKAAADKRAAMQAAQEAENARRYPLHKLLQERINLVAIIERNKSSIAFHTTDAAEFEKMCHSFFYHESTHQARMYPFLCADQNYPLAAASRAVELLTALLAKAEKDLADLESKIVTLAKELDLIEILPADLKK